MRFIGLKTGNNYHEDPAGGKTVYIRIDTIISVADFQNQYYAPGDEGNNRSVIQDGAMILFNAGSGESNSTFVQTSADEIMERIFQLGNK